MLSGYWLRRISAEAAGKLIDQSRVRSRRKSEKPGENFLCLAERLESRFLLSAAPFVESINRSNPAGPTTSSTTVNYTITFSEPVTGVDPSDFALITDGVTATLPVVVIPKPPAVGQAASVYTLTINGISGSGSLGLNLVDDNSIRDAFGNALVQANGAISFATQQTFGAGNNPGSAAVADVNGDGKLDLVVPNFSSASNSGAVSVLLGNGNGTFQSLKTFASGIETTSVAVADLNGDGLPDLVASNATSNTPDGRGTVSVLLGNGNGTFQPQQIFTTDSNCWSVVVADVNGDGIPDLVTANNFNGDVSVLLGNGGGTFQPEQTFAAAGDGNSVAVSDVNGDGHLDLVIANRGANNVSVLLGNGNGTFQNQRTSATGRYPNSVAIADLNGDGQRDLVIANQGYNTVSMLLGNGNGTFQGQQTFATGRYPNSVAVSDLNGDGNLDLAVANGNSNNLSVLLGNGNGTFRAQQTFATGSGQLPSVRVSDLNGDTRPDLVVANSGSNTMSVLLAGTNGNFTGQVYTVIPASVGTPAGSVSAPDIIASGGATQTITIIYSDTAAFNASSVGPSNITVSGPSGGLNVSGAIANPMGDGNVLVATYTVAAPAGGWSTADNGAYTIGLGPSPVTDAVGDAVSSLSGGFSIHIQPARIGALDPSFGSGGIAAHDVGFSTTNGLAVQADGKSVMIGTIGSAPNESFGLTRYNADGSLDTTFGSNGVVTTSFGSTDDVPSAVSVLPGGQILVAGTATTYASGNPAGSQFALAEYNPDGSVDMSFGGGTGQLLLGFSSVPATLSNDIVNAMAIGRGGTIYLGGSSDASGRGFDFAIAALNPDGSLAGGFGTGGKLLVDFAGGDDSLNALAVQINGDIVAAGSATSPAGVTSVALLRLLPNGSLDARFGSKGKIVTSVRGVDEEASSMVIQPDGKIVIGGLSATGSDAAGTLTSDFLLIRYTSAGKLDRKFGHGPVISSFGQPAAVTGLVLQSNGQIIASGQTSPSLASFAPNQFEIALARYNTTGRLDTSFNQSGQNVISVSLSASPGLLHSSALLPLDSQSLKQKLDELSHKYGGVASGTGGDILEGLNSGTNTVEAAIITAGVDLAISVLSSLPASAHAGSKATATIQITEKGTQTAIATVTIQLELASDAQGTNASPPQNFSQRLNLRKGKGKNYHLKFLYPTDASGSYYLVATLNVGSLRQLNPADLSAASRTAVRIG